MEASQTGVLFGGAALVMPPREPFSKQTERAPE
jgi:hypothetical protein